MIMYMTTKKQQSRKNNSRSNKKQKQQQKKQKLFIGGTCAMCGSCMNQSIPSPLFRGGKTCTWKRRRGGSGGNDTPLNGLSQRYYYSQNLLANDPNSPDQKIASRQLTNLRGGKTRTKKSMKGGLGFSFFNGQSFPATSVAFNPLNTIGDISTSQIASNYLSGDVNQTVLPNPSVFSQPVESKYNMYNMPLA